jgi:hypothetical protein
MMVDVPWGFTYQMGTKVDADRREKSENGKKDILRK